MLKKLLVSLLIATIFLGNFASTTKAAWYDQGPLEFSEKVLDSSNNDIFGERYTFAQVRWVAYSLLFLFVSPDVFKLASSFEQASLEDINLKKIAESQGYLQLGEFFSFFYTNPPASGISWTRDSLEKFNIVQPAYAQSPGFGFDALKVFRPLWTISRNIAYALMTILILFVAFAVMFRARINPQTVVTLQSSIPKIVSVILLITFSYAIAGFLIDMMYLTFGVIVFAIDAFGGATLPNWQGPTSALNSFATGDVGNLIGFVATNAGRGIIDFGSSSPIAAIFVLIMLIIAIGIIILLFVPPFGVMLLPFVLGLLFAVVSFIFKFFIMMTQTYLSLLFNVVAGPLIILFEAVPGNKGATIGWLRSLIADILVFLVVGLVIFTTGILIDTLVGFSEPIWGPPYTGDSGHFLAAMIAFGSIMMLANTRKAVYQFMQKRELELGIRDFQGVGRPLTSGWESFDRLRSYPEYRNVPTGNSFGAKTGRFIRRIAGPRLP